MNWSILICTRVLLNVIIIRCIACVYEGVHGETTREVMSAYSALQGIVKDVAVTSKRQLKSNRKPNFLNSESKEDKLFLVLRGYFMIWPLAFIWSLGCLTSGQRKAVAEQLRYIAQQLGIYCAVLPHDMRAPSWFNVEDIPCVSSHAIEECTELSPDLHRIMDPLIPGGRGSAPRPNHGDPYTQEENDALLYLYQKKTRWGVTEAPFPYRTSFSLRSQAWTLKDCKLFTAKDDQILIQLREKNKLSFQAIADKMERRIPVVSMRYKQLRPIVH